MVSVLEINGDCFMVQYPWRLMGHCDDLMVSIMIQNQQQTVISTTDIHIYIINGRTWGLTKQN